MRWWGGLSPRRRVLLSLLMVLAMVGLVAGGLTAYRLNAEGPRLVPAQDRPGPVVLVPGYGGGVGSLEILADRIRATGREVRVLALPDGGTGDLNRQAAALDAEVRNVRRGRVPSVDVVGYSAGGVVARLWAQGYDGAHKARRVITLGSPHHGVRLAAAGAVSVPGACPTACRQLAPGSSLLTGLATPVPNPPAWLSVWTEQDQTVTPPDSARLEGAVNIAVQSLCPTSRIGHSQLPTDASVTRLVLAAIGTAALEPAALAAGGCVSS